MVSVFAPEARLTLRLTKSKSVRRVASSKRRSAPRRKSMLKNSFANENARRVKEQISRRNLILVFARAVQVTAAFRVVPCPVGPTSEYHPQGNTLQGLMIVGRRLSLPLTVMTAPTLDKRLLLEPMTSILHRQREPRQPSTRLLASGPPSCCGFGLVCSR